jgi:diacylglycerol kinase family enzyme
VLLNTDAGQLIGADAGKIRSLIASAFPSGTEIRLLQADEFFRQLERAFSAGEYSTIIVGGGDGTMSAAARLGVEHDRILGLLPMGTFNLFARALGIPLRLKDALQALSDGTRGKVDVGVMNGRPFFNHVSLGFHPRVVKLRNEFQYSGRLSKFFGGVRAFFRLAAKAELIQLKVSGDFEPFEYKTPLAAVTVNPVPDSFGQLPFRPGQRYGKLGCYLLPPSARSEIFTVARDLFLGKWSEAGGLEFRESAHVRLSYAGKLHASVDGEVELLPGPLEFEIRPGALRVLLPAE